MFDRLLDAANTIRGRRVTPKLHGAQPDTAYPVCSYTLGLDLGQAQDPTALVVVQETWGSKYLDGGTGGWVEEELRPELRAYALIHAERFPLGTNYMTIVADTVRRVNRLRRDGIQGS